MEQLESGILSFFCSTLTEQEGLQGEITRIRVSRSLLEQLGREVI